MTRGNALVLGLSWLLPFACVYPDFSIRRTGNESNVGGGAGVNGTDATAVGGNAPTTGSDSAGRTSQWLGGRAGTGNGPERAGASNGGGTDANGGAVASAGTLSRGGEAPTDGGSSSVAGGSEAIGGNTLTNNGGSSVETGGLSSRGGASSASGGAVNGGNPPVGGATAAGGVATGGISGGGVAAGGVATGGVATGGVATGGVATGGVATGGVATGGRATGGTATGGAATGGLTGTDGWTSRYWDCCKPSCAWQGNVPNGYSALSSCDVNNNKLANNDAPSACGGGSAHLCWDLAPWADSSDPNLAYGFASFNGVACGSCYKLGFTGGNHSGSNANASALVGKSMIVQIINIGGIEANQFDLLIPGGGIGDFNACSSQWNVPTGDLGQRYGGFLAACAGDKACTVNKCSTVFGSRPLLKAGCDWFTGWFNAADNPVIKYQQVACPTAITAKSGFGS